MNKSIFYYLLIASLVLMPCYSGAQKISPKVKKILFLGNSITWQGNYINDIETYLISRNPGKNYEIINAGLPSETLSGLSESGHAGGSFPRPDLAERLERVLDKIKPDLVFACYGMNDGIYLPFDNNRFQQFKEGIQRLRNYVIKSGATLIHLTPPDYDELKGKSAGYAAVLDRYTDWLLNQRQTLKWEVIDVHYPMKRYLQARRKKEVNSTSEVFALAPDGIHPNETGHWIMAREVLKYLGYKDVHHAGIMESLAPAKHTTELLKMVTTRQVMMRDAWLTATRHIRPGLPTGLALEEAQAKYKQMSAEIGALLHTKPRSDGK
ncbi:MAG: SGNH/GDSL hydrolase family protein [Chitinophagaceae bacterium]